MSWTYLEHEGLERVEAGDQHVQPQVELIPIQQQRIGQVALDDHRLAVAHLTDVIQQIDAAAARRRRGLHAFPPYPAITSSLSYCVRSLVRC